jgi:hypothetical protein
LEDLPAPSALPWLGNLHQPDPKWRRENAIRHTTSRWTALTGFVDHGRVKLTNDAAECAVRRGRRCTEIQTFSMS